MQSMKDVVYALLVLAASAFVAWTAVHTDEETFTLAIILILALALGLAFPKYAVVTIVLLALPVSIMETLANYGFVHAPYPTSPGVSWAALVALVPAIVGALAGAWMRNLFRRTPAAA
jgi:hypothetical protein